MTLEQGKIRGYQMSEPYAEAMLPIAAKGLTAFCNFCRHSCFSGYFSAHLC